MPKILFTGGGSAGHVTVNLALIPKFREEGWSVGYIGSEQGIEKQLTASVNGLPYYGIATGKLRRYLDWNNVKDPFKVVKGAIQAYRIIRREQPQVIFQRRFRLGSRHRRSVAQPRAGRDPRVGHDAGTRQPTVAADGAESMPDVP